MTRPTKGRTVTNEITSLCRRERKLAAGSFRDLGLKVQLFEADSMGNVRTCEGQDDWLTFFERDFSGGKRKALDGYFDSFR